MKKKTESSPKPSSRKPPPRRQRVLRAANLRERHDANTMRAIANFARFARSISRALRLEVIDLATHPRWPRASRSSPLRPDQKLPLPLRSLSVIYLRPSAF